MTRSNNCCASQSFSSATMCNVGAPRTSSPKYSMRIALCELASGSGTSAPGSVEFTELLIFVARPGKLLDLLSETGVFLQRPASRRGRDKPGPCHPSSSFDRYGNTSRSASPGICPADRPWQQPGPLPPAGAHGSNSTSPPFPLAPCRECQRSIDLRKMIPTLRLNTNVPISVGVYVQPTPVCSDIGDSFSPPERGQRQQRSKSIRDVRGKTPVAAGNQFTAERTSLTVVN